ncbi:uncharacterized protein [Amphiura filiformis]|uniref:uncharacterized protein n=1 Tax=Amphiura filiformis TaxID=82378 RepID=UPI003B21923D
MNTRSIREKTTTASDYLISENVDILFLTETWLNINDQVVNGECTQPGYVFNNFPRRTSNHGGIATIYRQSMNLQIVNHGNNIITFEHAGVLDRTNDIPYVIVYRPPPSRENGFQLSTYQTEFKDFMSEIALMPRKVIVVGDFNMHVDIPSKSEVRRFLTGIETSGFQQHVTEPTHISGHILDLVISRPDDNLIHSCRVQNNIRSDHFMVNFLINQRKPSLTKKTVTYRNFKSIDHVKYIKDVKSELGNLSSELSPDLLIANFNSKMQAVLDHHAPETIKTRTIRPQYPWYNSSIHEHRQRRRKLERKWRKSDCLEDKQAYIDQKNLVNQLIESAKVDYYKDKLENSDTKGVFQTVNSLLNAKNDRRLPTGDSLQTVCTNLADYFTNKVVKIREELDHGSQVDQSVAFNNDYVNTVCSFSEFSQVTEIEVSILVTKSPSKTCKLDSIPT